VSAANTALVGPGRRPDGAALGPLLPVGLLGVGRRVPAHREAARHYKAYMTAESGSGDLYFEVACDRRSRSDGVADDDPPAAVVQDLGMNQTDFRDGPSAIGSSPDYPLQSRIMTSKEAPGY
jgi:hypothetical protein